MNTQIVNQLLKLLTEISELARELYRALQEGLPLFSRWPEKAAIDLTTVHRKPAEAKEPVNCYATVTECNDAEKKEKENEKRKNQRKEIKKNKKTKDDTSIGPAKETVTDNSDKKECK